MTDFKWRIAILDDDSKNIRSLAEDLSNFGFYVSTICETVDFDQSFNDLCWCNIALMDLDWGKCLEETSYGQENVLPSPPQTVDFFSWHDFVQNWIKAIGAWGRDAAHSWEPPTGKWPKTQIGSREIGLWLTAMMSHLNPHCEVILYSGKSGVGVSGDLAPLGRFRNAQFDVVKKSNVGDFSIDDLLSTLLLIQKKQIASNIEFRDWFLEQVMLRILLNLEPSVGNFIWLPRYSEQSVHRTLVPNLVFPQLKQMDKCSIIPFLMEFIPKRLLDDWQKEALHSVEHQSRPGNRAKYTDIIEIKEQIRRLLSVCFEVGDAAQGLIKRLQSILTISNDVSTAQSDWAETWLDSFSLLHDARFAMADMCKFYGGTYRGNDNILGIPPNIKEYIDNNFNNKGRFNLNMSELRISITQLVDELSNLQLCKLDCEETDDNIILTWLDMERSFDSLESFQTTVAKSIELKGPHRGWPCILLTALRMRASQASVYIDNSWSVLFSQTNKDYSNPVGPDVKGGFRWVFTKTQEQLR